MGIICPVASKKIEIENSKGTNHGEFFSGFKRTASTRDKDRKKIRHYDERNQDEASKEAVTAIVTNKKKTPEDEENILRTLRGHFIFKNLDTDSQYAILDSVKHYAVGAREIIFEQGQPGVCFFCVAKGRLEVLCNGEKTGNIIYPGTGFGELALLDDSPRTATIRTLEPCSLWGVDQKTFNAAIKRVNEINYEENKKFIFTVPIFNILTNHQKEALLLALITQKWTCGQTIIKEGEAGESFYIIKEGIVSCYENKIEKRQLGKGDYFGEQALLYNKPRTATVVAATDVKVVSIGREILVQVLGSSLEQILYRNSMLIAIDKSLVLRSLNSAQIESIIKNSELKKYNPGEVVIQRDSSKNSKLLILLKGSIRGPLSDIEVHTCIGDADIANFNSEKYTINYIANEECDVSEITNENLKVSIGGDINQVTINNEATNLLSKVALFQLISANKIEVLTNALKIQTYSDQDHIIMQGCNDQSFFIIRSGLVKVCKDNQYIRDITRYDYFGERSALLDTPRSASVVAIGNVECWVLEKSDFLDIINDSIKKTFLTRIEFQDSDITLQNLVPLKVLGTGKFGNVVLVSEKTQKNLFAVKTIAKAKVQVYNIYDNLLIEKHILMQLNHAFIGKLYKTFKDESRIYFLMEYVHGIDLFDTLLELDVISEEISKFYMACFILILEYLHERNIVHRDLKPENVMIDEEGYPKLIDFGTSKIIAGRTYTTVGTPHYIAPEIILKNGYTTTVDFWSLGIMLYEIIFGKVPFGADEEDPKAIYEKILEHKLDLSQCPYNGNNYKLLIQQLLNVNPAARLGGGIDRLKNHAWFLNFNWNKLVNKQRKVPFLPKVKKIEDLEYKQSIQEMLTSIENSEGVIRRTNTFKEVPLDWDRHF